ncbi:MAG: hypothetical protein STSR0009_10240 [Methanoregula sp.]
MREGCDAPEPEEKGITRFPVEMKGLDLESSNGTDLPKQGIGTPRVGWEMGVCIQR